MVEPGKKNIVAVVVTYEPELDLLAKLLEALTPQVNLVVVIDNGSTSNLETWNSERSTPSVEVIRLGKNLGIANAQNQGIAWAKSKGAELVLLMDQDSIPAADMVEKLANAIATLEAEGKKVACVGPNYTDSRHAASSPFVRREGMKLKRVFGSDASPFVPVDFVISSGCLIPLKVLDAVGGMLDDLFIDYVDVEWGLRAQHLGYQSYGIFSARLQHRLGEEPIQFAGRIVPSHNPLRSYYRFRNGVYLLKQPWLGRMWFFTDVRRLFLMYVFFALFSKARLKHIKMMSLGIWHSFLGRMGRFE